MAHHSGSEITKGLTARTNRATVRYMFKHVSLRRCLQIHLQLHSVIHRSTTPVTRPGEASGDQPTETGPASQPGPTPQQGDTPSALKNPPRPTLGRHDVRRQGSPPNRAVPGEAQSPIHRPPAGNGVHPLHPVTAEGKPAAHLGAGAYALDQSFRHLWLLVAALLITTV